MDRGAWRAVALAVAKSWTRLSTAHKLCLRHMRGGGRKWRQRIRLRERFPVLLTLKLGERVTSKVEAGEGKVVMR